MPRAVWMRSGFLFAMAGVLIAGMALAHNKDWVAPDAAKKMKNPIAASPAVLKAAKEVYADACAQCHGDTGKGDGPEAMMYSTKPANFTDGHMMGEMTDGEIFWKIGEGREPMPTFKKQLTDEQRWQLVHYVRAFSAKPASPDAAKKPASKSAPAKSSAAPHKH